MKKDKLLNYDVLLRATILLLYAAFFVWLILSDVVLKYVHPRTIPFIILSVVILVVGAIALCTQLFKPQKQKVNAPKLAILCLPLFLGFYIPPADVTSFVPGEKSISIGANYSIEDKNEELKGAKGQTFNKNLLESPYMKEKEVKIEDRNFLSWIEELFMNPYRHVGKPFEMTANILNSEIDGKKLTYAGRYVMTCCLADLEPKGILIKTDKSFDNNDWVYIKGTMSTEKQDGQIVPVVLVNYIEKTQNKGIDYIYGY